MFFARKTLAVIAISCVGVSAVMAAVTEPQKESAAARYAHMNKQANSLGILAKMIQGRVPYDANAAKAAAADLRALASEDWTSYLMPGTSSQDIETSRASPAIWESPNDFAARKQAFIKAATDMESAAGNGLPAMKTQLPVLSEACGACHRDFRTIP